MRILTLRELSIKVGGIFVDPTMYAQWQTSFSQYARNTLVTLFCLADGVHLNDPE